MYTQGRNIKNVDSIGPLSVTDTSVDITANLTVDSPTFIVDSVSNIVSMNGNVNIDSGVLFVDGVTNRVGINTTTPTANLDVRGNALISGGLNVDNGTLFLDAVNNRVSINDSSFNIPERALHVRGDAIRLDRSGQPSGIQFHHYASGGYSTILKGFVLGAAGAGVNDGQFFINDFGTAVSGGSTRRFTIDNNGNVGIGTSNPSQALDVSGSAVISGGLNVDAGTLFIDSTNDRIGLGTTSTTAGYRLTSNGSMSIVNPNTSTTPTLDVQDTRNAVEVVPLTVSVPNLSTGRNTTWRFGVNTTAAYNQAQISHFYSASGSDQNRLELGFFGVGARMAIRGDGSVGIGTTSPSQLLDVNGGLRNTGICVLSQGATGRYVEVGSATNFSYLDFHSLDSTNNDFDVRVSSFGGTAGTLGQGAFKVEALTTEITGTITLRSSGSNPTASTQLGGLTTVAISNTSLPVAGTNTQVATVVIPFGVWQVNIVVQFRAENFTNWREMGISFITLGASVPVDNPASLLTAFSNRSSGGVGFDTMSFSRVIQLTSATTYYFNAFAVADSATVLRVQGAGSTIQLVRIA